MIKNKYSKKVKKNKHSNKVKKTKYKPHKKGKGSMLSSLMTVNNQNNSVTCPICYEESTKDNPLVYVPCQLKKRHFFCKNCIEQIRNTFINREKFPQCPFCSKQIGINNSYNELYINNTSPPLTVLSQYNYNEFFKDKQKTINIPETIKIIDKHTFQHRGKNIHLVYIPYSVNTIGIGAFFDCKSLEKVKFDLECSIKELSQGLFDNCSKLKKIILPNSVETIGQFAFNNCISLKTISLTDNIKHLHQKCFSNSGLKSIKIPRKVQYINGSFYDCRSLKNIEFINKFSSIPSPREYERSKLVIGINSFTNCLLLKTITLPNHTINIHKNAFIGCINLKTVIINTSKDNIIIDENAFENHTRIEFRP